ncbi:MAG: dockerin type I repeat-containing protein, partial [Clostridiales bacterium]|nr:dockerin type I repeat-containing protein [Candidatus Apopatocola equi]
EAYAVEQYGDADGDGVVTSKDAGKGLVASYIAGYGQKRTDRHYLSWTGGVGSSFMTFWNDSTNLNYFLDYQYPLGRPGWGSTSDQQALQDGAAIEVHLIEDPNVQGSQYGYFTDADGVWDTGSVKEGSPLELTLYQTNSWYGGTNEPTLRSNAPVYCIHESEYGGDAISDWTKIGDTDANGRIEIPATLEAGTYYIGTPGKVIGGSELAPSIYRLTVREAYAVEQYGDADGDGVVTSKDATLVLQAVAQKEVEIDNAAADVDGDGVLTAKDATCILRYVAKTITIFPVEGTTK